MTLWQTRRELVMKHLTMWRVFRIVDGVEELGIRLYGTQGSGGGGGGEHNTKKKAPETAATAQGARQ